MITQLLSVFLLLSCNNLKGLKNAIRRIDYVNFFFFSSEGDFEHLINMAQNESEMYFVRYKRTRLIASESTKKESRQQSNGTSYEKAL